MVRKYWFKFKKKNLTLFIITVTLCTWIFAGLDMNLNLNLIINNPNPSTIHSKVFLDGNAQLEVFMSGNGTDGSSMNPHIIENLIIEIGSDEVGIELRNISQYLIIKNCTINNHPLYEGFRGIGLTNCSNIEVNNCNTANKSEGISVFNSSNIILTGNNVCDNGINGILMSFSNDSIIINNNASNNLYYGISIANSKNVTISDNILHRNNLGCTHDHLGESNNIYDNDCIEGAGIQFYVPGYNNVTVLIFSLFMALVVFIKLKRKIQI